MQAAEAAEAAGAQGKFWEMHAMLYVHQDALDLDNLARYAAELRLDVDRVIVDLETHRHLPRIEEELVGGARSGVHGTPCFFIDEVRYDGPWDAASLSRAIEHARRAGHPGVRAR